MSETYSIKNCARCVLNHEDLEFKALKHPIEMIPTQLAITHWADCPLTGEPVLMRHEPQSFACRR